MGKRYTFDGDANSDPKRRPMPVNGDGDTSEHTEPIDGAAIPRDLDHDLPSVAAIIAEATAEVEALGNTARAAAARWSAPEIDVEAITATPEPCPYCTSTRTERIAPTLLECLTCESVTRDGDEPARMFRMPTVAIFGQMRHGMKRRQIIARDYACHTATGVIRLAERLGYRRDDSYPYNLTFTRSDVAAADATVTTSPTE